MQNEKRKNGFSWPPDKAQIISVCFVLYFGLMFPGTFVMALEQAWATGIGIVFGLAFGCLVVLFLIIMYIDPSEFSGIEKKKVSPGNFDRQKHKHVIENQFCNICKMVVSYKAKHCRKCNKCVTNFDHHCVYLNNCIGSKNYKLFIALVVNACLGSFFIFLLGIIEFAYSFYTDQHFLTKFFYEETSNCTMKECDEKHKSLPVLFIKSPLNVWRAFIGITSLLALIAFGLIGYLLAYHVYLKINNMSTYEHSLLLRDHDKVKAPPQPLGNPSVKSKAPDTKITKIEAQHITSIDETLPVDKSFSSFHKLNRTTSSLSNEVNYMELSSKQSNKLQQLKSSSKKKLTEDTEFDLKETDSQIDSELTDKETFPANSVVDINASTRIPCMNSDPKNKYSKFENENLKSKEQFSSESSNSTFSQRQVPLFLPITSNLSDDENYDIYVKRSNRRSKIVKLPVNYYDTSPELTVRNSREVAESIRNDFDTNTKSFVDISARKRIDSDRTGRETPQMEQNMGANSATFLNNHSDSDESIQIKSIKFEKYKKRSSRADLI